MAADSFIPNSFQTPNAYVDRLMALLTSDEYKVLSYAARRIFGFQKRADRISLSQFAGGVVNKKTGERFDYGTGLSENTCRAAVHKLVEYGVLVEAAPNDSRVNAGPLYTLQLDADRVDFAALEARRADHDAKNTAQRTERATRASLQKRGLLPPNVGHTPLRQTLGDTSHVTTPLTSDVTTPPTWDVTTPLTSDVTHNNHGKPEENQGETAPPPADPFDAIPRTVDLRAERAARAAAAQGAARPIRCPRLDECPAAFQGEVGELLTANPHITAEQVQRQIAWFRQDTRREVRTLAEWLEALRGVVVDEIDKWRPVAPVPARKPPAGPVYQIIRDWN